jgi:hypothetical protein
MVCQVQGRSPHDAFAGASQLFYEQLTHPICAVSVPYMHDLSQHSSLGKKNANVFCVHEITTCGFSEVVLSSLVFFFDTAWTPKI